MRSPLYTPLEQRWITVLANSFVRIVLWRLTEWNSSKSHGTQAKPGSTHTFGRRLHLYYALPCPWFSHFTLAPLRNGACQSGCSGRVCTEHPTAESVINAFQLHSKHNQPQLNVEFWTCAQAGQRSITQLIGQFTGEFDSPNDSG